jgi:hypothetical protein
MSIATSAVSFHQNIPDHYSNTNSVDEGRSVLNLSIGTLSPLPMSDPHHVAERRYARVRNRSLLSYGSHGSGLDVNRSSFRGMSITSDGPFNRAMSWLSGLSLDCDNLEDFDVDVDYSAHIHQTGSSPNQSLASGGRRSSGTRRSSVLSSMI